MFDPNDLSSLTGHEAFLNPLGNNFNQDLATRLDEKFGTNKPNSGAKELRRLYEEDIHWNQEKHLQLEMDLEADRELLEELEQYETKRPKRKLTPEQHAAKMETVRKQRAAGLKVNLSPREEPKYGSLKKVNGKWIKMSNPPKLHEVHWGDIGAGSRSAAFNLIEDEVSSLDEGQIFVRNSNLKANYQKGGLDNVAQVQSMGTASEILHREANTENWNTEKSFSFVPQRAIDSATRKVRQRVRNAKRQIKEFNKTKVLTPDEIYKATEGVIPNLGGVKSEPVEESFDTHVKNLEDWVENHKEDSPTKTKADKIRESHRRRKEEREAQEKYSTQRKKEREAFVKEQEEKYRKAAEQQAESEADKVAKAKIEAEAKVIEDAKIKAAAKARAKADAKAAEEAAAAKAAKMARNAANNKAFAKELRDKATKFAGGNFKQGLAAFEGLYNTDAGKVLGLVALVSGATALLSNRDRQDNTNSHTSVAHGAIISSLVAARYGKALSLNRGSLFLISAGAGLVTSAATDYRKNGTQRTLNSIFALATLALVFKGVGPSATKLATMVRPSLIQGVSKVFKNADSVSEFKAYFKTRAWLEKPGALDTSIAVGLTTLIVPPIVKQFEGRNSINERPTPQGPSVTFTGQHIISSSATSPISL